MLKEIVQETELGVLHGVYAVVKDLLADYTSGVKAKAMDEYTDACVISFFYL